MKFERFIDVLFKSRMQTEDVKDQIVKYVQALETSYTDAVRDIKTLLEKEKKESKKIYAEQTNNVADRNELETLFVDCIEEVRKDIMKRRLKNEIYNRKKFTPLDPKTEEA